MRIGKSAEITVDPRTGLLLLLMANIIAFSEKSVWVEAGWMLFMAVLVAACGYARAALKCCLTYGLIVLLQWYILPVSPAVIAVSFSIFANYARRMCPCLIAGTLLVKAVSLRRLIVGLRCLHVPQQLIIPISVTLRYFPAIREEAGYIRDAMRLRNIRGLQKAEALVVPLMISATETAEELSAAAVTRGIENPVAKTSVIALHMGAADWCSLAVALALTVSIWIR